MLQERGRTKVRVAAKPKVKVKVRGPLTDIQTERPGYGGRRKVVVHSPVSERADSLRLSPAERRATNENAKRVKKDVQRQREQNFPKNPVKGLQRSERRAISALSDLKGSDPAKYAKNEQEASDTKILGVNVEKAGRNVNHEILKAGEKLKGLLDHGDHSSGYKPNVSGFDSPKAGKEILDLVANAPTSVYLAGAAGVEAAKGDTSRAKKLWKDYKKTSAVSAAISGNFKEAAKRAGDHPITTGLELSGAKALVGRGAGAALRKAPVPGKTIRAKARAMGSTERANLRLTDAKPGEGPEVERTYSKDAINKRVQVAAERRAVKKGRDPNVAPGEHVQRDLRLPPHLNPRGAVSQLRRRADTRVYSQDRVGQHRKMNAAGQIRKIARVKPLERIEHYLVTGKIRMPDKGAAVHLAAEGTVRIDRVRLDLRKRKLAGKASASTTGARRRAAAAEPRRGQAHS